MNKIDLLFVLSFKKGAGRREGEQNEAKMLLDRLHLIEITKQEN